MNPATIIAAIQAVTALATEASALFSTTKAALGSTDLASLQAELAKLQAANDTLTATVQAKLQAAASES